MASRIVQTMVSRGDAAEWIQKLYREVKNKPFTIKAAESPQALAVGEVRKR